MKQKQRALEAYLVAAARHGNRKAIAQLFELRGPRLLAHATRLLGERDGAQDVVQDAWADILRSIGSLRDVNAFLPWALRIVSRRVARDISRRQRSRKLARDYAQEMDGTVPEQGPAAADGYVVRQALRQLPKEQAATLALFYLEDLSVTEVATALDVPVGTVKTRLMHARRKLREELKGLGDG